MRHEAAGMARMPGMRAQPVLGGEDQPGLFGRGDRGGSVAVARALAVAHFDEYHGVAIAHDQIQFAVAGRVVARQQGQAGALQFATGTLLEAVTRRAHQFDGAGWALPPVELAGAGAAFCGGVAGGIASICRLPVSGRARPFWNFAQVNTRRIRPNWSAAS